MFWFLGVGIIASAIAWLFYEPGIPEEYPRGSGIFIDRKLKSYSEKEYDLLVEKSRRLPNQRISVPEKVKLFSPRPVKMKL